MVFRVFRENVLTALLLACALAVAISAWGVRVDASSIKACGNACNGERGAPRDVSASSTTTARTRSSARTNPATRTRVLNAATIARVSISRLGCAKRI